MAEAVDQAGAALRKLNADNAPRLRAKMRELKDRKAWSDADFEDKALAAVQDERIEAYNAQANDLLAKLDALGSIEPASEADCGKIEELSAASLELQATIKAKAVYTLSKLDQMLAPAPGPQPPEGKVRAADAAKPRSEAPRPVPAPPPAPPAPPSVAPRSGPPGKGPETSGWSAQTKGDASRDVAILQPPPQGPLAPMPPSNLGPDEEGYSIDEIMAASAGFFGKVSANLGAVIEYLFQNSGRPSGYVLGTEGGGAFLAGVRYGSGTLYLRAGGSQKIYWHGPSLGTDVGAEGSKTLFLIYRLGVAGTDVCELHRHRRLGLFGGRRRRDVGHQRQRHHGADPLRHGAKAGRQYRLHPLHAEGDLESVLRTPAGRLIGYRVATARCS